MSSSGSGGGGSSGRGRGNRGRNRGGRGGSGGGASVIRHGGGGRGRSNRPHPSAQLAPSQVAAAKNDYMKEENEKEPDPRAVCLVCYDDTLPHQRAILPCGHDGVCGPCHLRLRYLNTDKCVKKREVVCCIASRCVELCLCCCQG